ncbi:MAG: hypothetical protein ACM3OF_00035 [Gemmatimonas sp.]
MLRDGEYAAWFRTPHGEGTGIVHLAGGKISGRDSFFSYSGSYQVAGGQFSATLTIRRYADGPTTLFGVDEVDLAVTGAISGTIACCSGVSEQAPGVHFEATLILNQQPSPGPAAKRPVSANVATLPNTIAGRSRIRNSAISRR